MYYKERSTVLHSCKKPRISNNFDKLVYLLAEYTSSFINNLIDKEQFYIILKSFLGLSYFTEKSAISLHVKKMRKSNQWKWFNKNISLVIDWYIFSQIFTFDLKKYIFLLHYKHLKQGCTD